MVRIDFIREIRFHWCSPQIHFSKMIFCPKGMDSEKFSYSMETIFGKNRSRQGGDVDNILINQ